MGRGQGAGGGQDRRGFPGTGKVPFLPLAAAHAGVPTCADSLGRTLLVVPLPLYFYLKVLV